jgi:hypothetical protein
MTDREQLLTALLSKDDPHTGCAVSVLNVVATLDTLSAAHHHSAGRPQPQRRTGSGHQRVAHTSR